MTVQEFFESAGALASRLSGYEERPGQQTLAAAVAQTLGSGGVLLAEAGTGTGKTLAYLLPAVLSGRKVVVSTATKTLQSQILGNDVPLLAQALGKPVAAVLLKGRQNFLCLRRFEAFRSRPLFRFQREAAVYDRLEQWAGATRTGDRSELEDLPDDFGPWREVCSSSETCWGGRCPREADCHFQQRRRAAQKAQLVVVNHHLFLSDLAVRATSPGEVIPHYGAVILDEAHQIEDAATQYFGTRVSSYRLAELTRDISRMPTAEGGAPRPLADALASVAERGTEFWRVFPRQKNLVRLRAAPAGADRDAIEALLEALQHLADRWAPRQAESPEAESVQRRIEELSQDLGVFLRAPEAGEVRWIETRGAGTFLHAAPVRVAAELERHLFSRAIPVVLTSATLSLGGDFAYVRERLGIPESAVELALASPFDYPSQGLLFVPRGMQDPAAATFPGRVAREIRSLLEVTRGRAFCLFTSHRVLRAVAEEFETALPYPLLVQGEAPREVLIERFRSEPGAVLLGAQSFWEGVDVPGDALSAVIIDKLPFAHPSDPLVEARIEQLEAEGRQPFLSYQVPAAAMALRQGAGRLIRRGTDRGLVAILDPRLTGRSYGAFFRQCLPPFPMTRELADVRAFFSAGTGS